MDVDKPIRAGREALGPVIPPVPQWASDAWGNG
jgi:hypothetical protein